MSVQERVAWFLQMPNGKFERPHWIAEELNRKIYSCGKDRLGKKELAEMLTSCAANSAGGDDDPSPVSEDEAALLLNDFFNYNDYTEDANVKVFNLHFARCELFKTIRYMRSMHGQSLPVQSIYSCFAGACGKYQGGKMAAHLAPDRFSSQPVPLEKVAQFYFSYEAMLLRDAVDGGSLSSFDIAKELLRAVEEGAVEQVELVLSHPQNDPNGKDDRGVPLLHVAIALDITDLVSLLLKKGADPNALNGDGNPTLACAIEEGNQILLNELIYHGADVNALNADKETMLMMAVNSDNELAVQTLLRAGADMEAKNEEGQTALEMCDDNEEIKTLLVNKKAEAAEAAAEAS